MILEEIKMDEDNPDYWCMKSLPRISGRTIRWASRSLGRKNGPLFGQEKLFKHYREHFSPNNMIISAAGNLNHHVSWS